MSGTGVVSLVELAAALVAEGARDALALQPGDDGRPGPLLSIRSRRRTCYPHRYQTDEARRTVTCMKCGALVDPIDAMLDIARNWERYAQELASMRSDIELLRAKREVLERGVRNLKARARRAER